MKNFEEIYQEIYEELLKNNNKFKKAWKNKKIELNKQNDILNYQKQFEKSWKKNIILINTMCLIILVCIILGIIFFIRADSFEKAVMSFIFMIVCIFVVVFFIAIATLLFGLLKSLFKSLFNFVVKILKFITGKKEKIGDNDYEECKETYDSLYKNIVINRLINNFYNTVEYFPNKSMPEYIYEKANYEKYDIYKSDDYFKAKINNQYTIQIAEVLTQEIETKKDSYGLEDIKLITKFHGLFANITMHKSINGRLRIIQDGKASKNKIVEMDSTEFEKYFDVQCSDKILGMRILTADVMEELVKFENKTKMKFDICINDDNLYLRFRSGDMFEPENLENEILDKDTIRKYFYMLNLTYNLSSILIKVINETII